MKRGLVNAILVLYGLGLIAGGIYYFFQQTFYFHSEIAQVKAEMVPIYPEQAGLLSQWSAEEGKQVERGEKLGAGTPFVSNLSSESRSYSPYPIVSPVKGVLLKSDAVVGETVKPGRPLAIVADLSKIYILAYIDEKDMDRVEPGKKAEITLDAYQGLVLEGQVKKVGAMAGDLLNPSGTSQGQAKEVQRVPVQISINLPTDVKLIPGMNAEVKIIQSSILNRKGDAL